MANKTPTRTCVACGKSGDKRSFVRIVRTPDGSIELDLTGKVAGRGAYLCKESSCFEKALLGQAPLQGERRRVQTVRNGIRAGLPRRRSAQ